MHFARMSLLSQFVAALERGGLSPRGLPWYLILEPREFNSRWPISNRLPKIPHRTRDEYLRPAPANIYADEKGVYLWFPGSERGPAVLEELLAGLRDYRGRPALDGVLLLVPSEACASDRVAVTFCSAIEQFLHAVRRGGQGCIPLFTLATGFRGSFRPGGKDGDDDILKAPFYSDLWETAGTPRATASDVSTLLDSSMRCSLSSWSWRNPIAWWGCRCRHGQSIHWLSEYGWIGCRCSRVRRAAFNTSSVWRQLHCTL